MSTSDPKQIILSHFLDYGSSTENILATYDSKTGAIAFDVSDASIAITSCAGSATKTGETVTVGLRCKPAASSDPECRVTYTKASGG